MTVYIVEETIAICGSKEKTIVGGFAKESDAKAFCVAAKYNAYKQFKSQIEQQCITCDYNVIPVEVFE